MSGPNFEPVHDRTHIDWLTLTHTDRGPLSDFLEGPTEELPRGFNVYPKAVRDGYGAMLAWDGPAERSALLMMPGKALAQWRARHEDVDLVFRLAFDGVHCTRIDLARDTAGDWTPYRLRDFVEAERFVSQFRGFSYHCGQGGEALTVSCGSRSSEVFLRVYDKRAEMESRGEPCPFPRLSRWEFELKGERASKMFRQLMDLSSCEDANTGEWLWPLGEVHAGLLRSRLVLTRDPVDRENKNHQRAEADPEWLSFLAKSRPCVLAPDIDERSAADMAKDMARWVRSSLASAVHVAFKLGGSAGIKELIRYGGEKLSAKHKMLLAHAGDTRPAFVAGLEERRT